MSPGPRLAGVLLGFALALFARSAVAQVAYTLDARENRVPIPQPYVRDLAIDGVGVDTGTFKAPSQVFVDEGDNLYVVDTGHNRVVRLDSQARPTLVLGPSLGLTGPRGVFVTPAGAIFIADTGNKRILEVDQTGRLVREIPRPSGPLEGDYSPGRVVVDRRGYLYVVDAGSAGLVVLDTGGRFRGYFGANRLPFDLRQLLIKALATIEQRAQLRPPQPSTHSNVVLAPDGFLYTVVATAGEDQIQKLNPVGLNVFGGGLDQHKVFGERTIVNGEPTSPRFADLSVDRFGVVSAIDQTSARIYQYDQARRLLAVFGGQGSGAEQFDFPVSLASDAVGRLYVLDGSRNTVYRLRPTQFTALVHQASQLHDDGRYDDAARLWRQVLKLHAEYGPAEVGLGRALRRQQEYPAAMDAFEQALDREGYSAAFAERRYGWLRANFGVISGAVLGLLLALALLGGRVQEALREKRRRGVASPVGSGRLAIAHAIGVLSHPEDTFWELRSQGAWWAPLLLVALACLARVSGLWLLAPHMLHNPDLKSLGDYLMPANVIAYYHLREVDLDEISPVLQALRVVVPWVAWVIVGYGLAVIFEGEGSLAGVARTSGSCLIPYVVFVPPIMAATHVMVRDERWLVDAALSLVYLWCIWLFYLQVKVVHDFQAGKALRVLGGTLAGMAVLIGFVGLLYLVTTQLLRVGWEVVYEITTL